jgi:hypothetical protein
MSILSRRRPPAKLHPDAATRRERRPFGEGLDDTLPRPWTPVEMRRAAAFGLRAPAVAAPIPSPVPAADPKPATRPGRRGPSAEDLAFESGRTIGLEAGYPVAAAFRLGMAEAGEMIRARRDDYLADLEIQARHDHGDYCDGRVALPRPVAVD